MEENQTTEEIKKIDEVSQAVQATIRNKSVIILPNNPSERGFTADELKKRFVNLVVDTDNYNVVAQLNRIVREANAAIEKLQAAIEEIQETADAAETAAQTAKERSPYIGEEDKFWYQYDAETSAFKKTDVCAVPVSVVDVSVAEVTDGQDV